MKKTQLTLNDVTESGFKILSVLDEATERLFVGQISIKIGLSPTTIRRLLQRIEAFGLVEDVLIDKTKHFTLTKDGRSFVKRINKTNPKSDEVPTPDVVVTTQTVIAPKQEVLSDSEPFNLSNWLLKKAQGLRALSDELTTMAYNLSSYEE